MGLGDSWVFSSCFLKKSSIYLWWLFLSVGLAGIPNSLSVCLRFNWEHFLPCVYFYTYTHMHIYTHTYIFTLYLCIYGGHFTCLFIFLAVEFSWKCFSGAVWSSSITHGGIRAVPVHSASSQPGTHWGLFSLLFFPCCFVCNLCSLGQISWFTIKCSLDFLCCFIIILPIKNLCGSWHRAVPSEMKCSCWKLHPDALMLMLPFFFFFFPTSIT